MSNRKTSIKISDLFQINNDNNNDNDNDNDNGNDDDDIYKTVNNKSFRFCIYCCIFFIILLILILIIVLVAHLFSSKTENNINNNNNEIKKNIFKNSHKHQQTKNEFNLMFIDENSNTITYNFKFTLERIKDKSIIYPNIIESDTIISYFNIEDIKNFEICCTTNTKMKKCEFGKSESAEISLVPLSYLIENKQTILLENINSDRQLLGKLKNENVDEVYLLINIYNEDLLNSECWFTCEVIK